LRQIAVFRGKKACHHGIQGISQHCYVHEITATFAPDDTLAGNVRAGS
jgi:hypothetical protein